MLLYSSLIVGMVVWVAWSVILCCFFKQKTAYDMRISDWSSDVCSSDLALAGRWHLPHRHRGRSPAPERRHVRAGRGAREETGWQDPDLRGRGQIGRASWRERVCQYV